MSIESMRASLQALASLGVDAAPLAAQSALAQVQASAAAGTSPDGSVWAPTRTGRRAMPNAASRLSVSMIGNVILLKLIGNEVFHHFGVRGAGPRNVLPTGSMPSNLGAAVRRGVVDMWNRKVRRK